MKAPALPAGFGRSALSSSAYTAIMAVITLVTTPILTGHLGPQRYGIWVLVGSTIAYLGLLNLGIGGAVVSFIARYDAAGDDDAIMRTLSTSFFVLVGLGLLAFGLIGIGAVVLPTAVHLSAANIGVTRLLLLLMGVDAALSLPMDTFGCGLVALQRFDLLNLSLISVVGLQAIAWTVVLASGGGLALLGAVTVAISLMGQFARFLMFRRLMPGFSISPKLVSRDTVRILSRPSGWFALSTSVEGLRDYATSLVLGIVRNVTTVGLYAIGEKLATFGTKFGTAVADPYFPHAAALVARSDHEELKRASTSGTQIAAGVIMPCCLVVAVLARPALGAWVGRPFERAAPAVIILAISASFASFDAISFKILSGSGGQHLLSLMSLAEASTSIVLTAILGYLYGIVGVAVAMLATVVLVEFGITFPLACRRLHVRVQDLVLPVLRAHLVPLLVAGIIGVFLGAGPVMSFVDSHGRVANLAVVAGAALAVLAAYALVFLATGVDRVTRRSVIARVSVLSHRTSAP